MWIVRVAGKFLGGGVLETSSGFSSEGLNLN